MPKQNKRSLILASASPRRRLLMRKHGYKFRIVPSHVSEVVRGKLSPRQFVNHLALKKAVHIAKKYPQSVVLGADTIVFQGGKIIGKPKHAEDASKILWRLSGAWQKVYTGVAIAWAGGEMTLVQTAVTGVKFRRLTDKDVRMAARKHLDKAGAYSVQQKNDPFVERMVGDYDNVVGLPMRVVKRLLGRCRQRLLKTVGHNIYF